MTPNRFWFWLLAIWAATALLIARRGMPVEALSRAIGVVVVGLLVGSSVYAVRSRRRPHLDRRWVLLQGVLAWVAIYVVMHITGAW
jgi:hypothetical protein